MVFDNENPGWDERLAGCQQAIGVRSLQEIHARIERR